MEFANAGTILNAVWQVIHVKSLNHYHLRYFRKM